jgi:predicted DNA-binding protein (MmcQ/YjbR family)
MTADALRRWCRACPGATEEFPFGDQPSVFKVGGKMFALSALESRPLRVSLKCEPELGEGLRATYPAIQPGYHLNKRHWVTITLDGSVPDETLFELLEDSYDLWSRGCRPRSGRGFGGPANDGERPVDYPRR